VNPQYFFWIRPGKVRLNKHVSTCHKWPRVRAAIVAVWRDFSSLPQLHTYHRTSYQRPLIYSVRLQGGPKPVKSLPNSQQIELKTVTITSWC